MTHLRFASLRQSVVIIVAWMAVMFAIDQWKNPRRNLFTKPAPPPSKGSPQVSLRGNHLCCITCIDDVQAALAGLGWVGNGKSRQAAAGGPGPTSSEAASLELPITNLRVMDFVTLDNTLHEAGLFAEHIVFGGMEDYQIEVFLRHVECLSCSQSLDVELRQALGLSAIGTLPLDWIKGYRVSKERRSILIEPKEHRDSDITAILAVLNQYGFSPFSIKIGPKGSTIDAPNPPEFKRAVPVADKDGHEGAKHKTLATPPTAVKPGPLAPKPPDATQPGMMAPKLPDAKLPDTMAPKLPDATQPGMMAPKPPDAKLPGAKPPALLPTRPLVKIGESDIQFDRPIAFVPNTTKITEESLPVVKALAEALQKDNAIKYIEIKLSSRQFDPRGDVLKAKLNSFGLKRHDFVKFDEGGTGDQVLGINVVRRHK